MELAALGTPDMPLSKARVPRQAATAAKEAIKKDLLQQKSRTGVQSVPPKASSMPAADKVQGVAKASNMKSKSRQKAKVQALLFPVACNAHSCRQSEPVACMLVHIDNLDLLHACSSM